MNLDAIGFNASHSFSYSFISYQMAYLKANYPVEFYAACIGCEDDPERKSLYIQDAKRNGVDIRPPDVNKSLGGFNVVNGSIFFGFNGIEGLGKTIIPKIIELAPFYSFGDFLVRTYMAKGFNKKVYEALIMSGSCDSFGFKRSCMMRSFEKFIADLDPKKKRSVTEEHIKLMLSAADTYFNDPSLSEFPYLSLLEAEYSLMGIYISGSPFDVIKKVVKSRYTSVDSSLNEVNGKAKLYCDLLLKINTVRRLKTKAGADMMILEANDHLNVPVSIAVFPDSYLKYKDAVKEGMYCVASVIVKSDGKFSLGGIKDLSAEVDTLVSTVVENTNTRVASIVIDGLPGVVRCKSVLAKVKALESEDSSYVIDLYFQSNGYRYFVSSYRSIPLDVDALRELNKIPDCFIIRN